MIILMGYWTILADRVFKCWEVDVSQDFLSYFILI